MSDEMKEGRLASDEVLEELERVDYSHRFRRSVRTTIYALITVAAIALLAATLILPVVNVYGRSMEPTIRQNSFLLAVKTGSPQEGDVLAFYYNNKVLVRRVIGCPGDVIDIDASGNVFRNGEHLQESYVSNRIGGIQNVAFPFEVPDGQYFVLADDRSEAVDSRAATFGCVTEENFIGVLKLAVWPLNHIGLVK